MRITYENLRLRDPELVERLARWFTKDAPRCRPGERRAEPPRPPMFTPFRCAA